MGNEHFGSFISRRDWSFERRAERDEQRHNEKVKEAIKGNLDSVVSDGSIITADPRSKKPIKIPMKSLELPDFRFGDPQEGVGTGTGDGDGAPQPGQQVPGEGEAGDQPGEEYYEAEFTIEEIQEMVFEDLQLPNLRPRDSSDIESTETNFNQVIKKRTTNNLDLGRTVIQNMFRNAQEGRGAVFGNVSPDDYRVRTWEEEKKPINNAVIIAMADISASMGDLEKYVTRAFLWWTLQFLRTKYPKVEVVFVAHDTEAHEVTEEQFFTRGMGGGTKCSSANKMAVDMITERYQTDKYNVYPLHFSDGDNFASDNDDCVKLVNQLLESDVSQYTYLQIGKASRSQLLDTYSKRIQDDRFKGLIIEKKDDVLKALKQVFTDSEELK